MLGHHQQGVLRCSGSPLAPMPPPIPYEESTGLFVLARLGGIGRWQPSPNQRRPSLRSTLFEDCLASTRIASSVLAQPSNAVRFVEVLQI